MRQYFGSWLSSSQVYKMTQQAVELYVVNFDFIGGGGVESPKLGKLLPNDVSTAFCGSSRCGKTNALLSLLLDENGSSI